MAWTRMIPLGALGTAALLAACANPALERAAAARTALVGMPRPALLSCAGVPDRMAQEANLEFFTYETGTVQAAATGPRAGVGVRGGTGGTGVSVGVNVPFGTVDRVTTDRCVATFTLRDGIVQNLQYRAGSLADCAPIVSSCLAG